MTELKKDSHVAHAVAIDQILAFNKTFVEQKGYEKYIADKSYLQDCYRKADEIAQKISQRTLDKAMKKIGFIA